MVIAPKNSPSVMALKEILSGIAIALTFVAYIPYILSIHRGKTRPHVFSWIIWGSTTLIVFFAQLADHGGIGAWPTAVSGAITLYVALLAYLKKSDINSDTHIATKDWWFLFGALASIPIWYFTSDPLWAVIILTLVDVMGFGPTFRKAYHFPHQEQI